MQASFHIGYDPRWPEAFAVARHSMRRLMSRAIPVGGVHLEALQRAGLYRREVARHLREQDSGNGAPCGYQLFDPISEAPMATEFAISRFLTPALAGWKGWAIFLDCDFLALTDPARILELLDPKYAVMCVQHQFDPPEGFKMDGQAQTRYARKNWSSFMAFNCEHYANAALTLNLINSAPGRDLHRFCWLSDGQIGALPVEWNWLVGHSDTQVSPTFVHFTDGGPWLPEFADVAFAEEWRRAHRLWVAGDFA